MAATNVGLGSKALNAGSSAVAPNTRKVSSSRVSHVAQASKTQKGRWAGMDAGNDASDDQQDIARGRGMVDELFQGWGGTAGTQNAIMSSNDYISQAQRSFGNIEDGFYISPSFLDKLSIHIAKNFMNLPKIKVPLILGIWGGKGQGKTFQCMLAFKKLGITPIVMSAGELESGNAGEPAKLIRQRYREASDQIKKGKMCCLFINDLDAGAGRFGLSTQYTVNNQMVNATLMNIADNPTNVQLPGVYKNEEIPRVPIICTGNDFSTLYAPLIRDGRMEKFYWNPTREDRIGVCMGIFMEDNLTRQEVETLVDGFPGQSIDFFGALRARVYDDKVREFVNQIGHENLNKRLVNSRDGKVKFEKPSMNLDVLMNYGRALVQEQDNVKRVQLADAYLAGAELAGTDGSSVPEEYDGARGLNLEKTPSRASWRSTPTEAPAPQAPPTPSYTPAPAAPAAGGATERWSPAVAPAPQRSAAPAAGGAARTLSASDLAVFKIADLVELAGKKGVSAGRNATRQSLVDGLVKAGVSTSDLTNGQLSELNAGGSAYASIPASPAPAAAAPAPAAPAAASGGDRWASYSRSSGSSSGGAAPAAGRGGSGVLSAGDLSSFKIVDLVEIAGKKGVSAGRNASRESLTEGLVKAGVSLEDLTRGQLVDLATKLGKAGLSRDLATARAELASLVGGSGSATATWRATPAPTASGSSGSSSSQTPPASWRSSSSSSSSGAAAASSGDRWAKYSAGASSPSAGSSTPWRRSGSHNASGSKLSAGDLSSLRIDDLSDLVKKTGAQLPREPSKDGVISALVAKGVSLNDLTRGMLVDLSNKLGAPLGRDVDSMRKNLASVVGKAGGYSPAAPAASSSSWRTEAPAAPSSSSGDRWANYSRSNGSGSSAASSGGAGGLVSERELSGLKTDTLSELARKKGIAMRNATKQDLVSQLSRVLKHSDLSKNQAAEIAAGAAAARR